MPLDGHWPAWLNGATLSCTPANFGTPWLRERSPQLPSSLRTYCERLRSFCGWESRVVALETWPKQHLL
jgi:hypothetical protein